MTRLPASSATTSDKRSPCPIPSRPMMNRPSVSRVHHRAEQHRTHATLSGERGRNRIDSSKRHDPERHLDREQPWPGRHRHDARRHRRARPPRMWRRPARCSQRPGPSWRLGKDESDQGAIDAHDAGAAEALHHPPGDELRQRRGRSRIRPRPACTAAAPSRKSGDVHVYRPGTASGSRLTVTASW